VQLIATMAPLLLASIWLVGTARSQPATRPEARLGPGDHTRELVSAGRERKYQIHIPRGLALSRPVPVVLAFHGGGGNPRSMIRLSGLNQKAAEAGFVVVYPFGSARFGESRLTFNAGNVGGYAMQQQIDDVTFTRDLLDDLAGVMNVDPRRVYATGMSNGAMMAYRLASELSDRIAAIAPVGGPMGTETCSPRRPVPVIHFHGTADELAPFHGGFGRLPDGSRGITDFYSVDHSLRAWIQANGCKPDPTLTPLPDPADDGTRATRKAWSGGRQGSEVVLIEIEGGGHTWPGQPPVADFLGPSSRDISANDLIWEFFTRHPMPEDTVKP
jgi:polyhydroxybutyrate depolymerase